MCIRTNLRFQEQSGAARCPLCRKPAAEHALRANLALRDLVAALRASRPVLLQMATASAAGNPADTRGGKGQAAARAAPAAGGRADRPVSNGAASSRRRRACRAQVAPAACSSPNPDSDPEEGMEVVDLTQAELLSPNAGPVGSGRRSAGERRQLRKRPVRDPDPEFSPSPTPSGCGWRPFEALLTRSLTRSSLLVCHSFM